MKVKIEAALTGDKSKIYEIDDLGNQKLLHNIRGATIQMDAGEISTLTMRIDIVDANVEGDVEAITKVCNKEGELKRIRRIEYYDGTTEDYV